jgi:hypothetical protein
MIYLRKNWKELLGAQVGVLLLVVGAVMGIATIVGPHIFGSEPYRWDEIVCGAVVAWVVFPFWCPMLEGGEFVYVTMLMIKGWLLGYGFVASCRSGEMASERLPAVVYWYCLTNGLACIYLILYGLARGGFLELSAKIVYLASFTLLGSIAITTLGLAIGLTIVGLLRKLLSPPEEPPA